MNILQKKIGIIGGGQLGKMMILDAKRLGFYVITLDPTMDCPSHSISDEHMVASFDDVEAIIQLAEQVDVITYEFEHIHVEVLKQLEAKGYSVYPTAKSLEIIQNKFIQKSKLQAHNIPVPRFETVDTVEDIKQAGKMLGYPLMLKTCLGGYDGKGNAVIHNQQSIEQAFQALGAGQTPLMIEAFVPLKKEISVLACRGLSGDISVYPVAENKHHNSILDETIVPADIFEPCRKKAMTLAHEVMEVFFGVGMFCVEMFVTQDDAIVINEVAPRPHNSGHYTIEGCKTSQFEQHIRAITGLPLGEVELIQPTVMKNLLGPPLTEGRAYYEGVDKAYALPDVKVHIYGKTYTKPFRKMGHITATDQDKFEALRKVRQAHQWIRIGGIEV